jgi:hypothetical protein
MGLNSNINVMIMLALFSGPALGEPALAGTSPDVIPLAEQRSSQAAVSEEEAYTIGVEAYNYFYPLVSMDLTRRVFTNTTPEPVPGHGPMNAFQHLRAFPDANFRAIVRPNFDTLYSAAWLDVHKEPVIVSVPDTQGRYYLLQMLDMWTDSFAGVGKRSNGTTAAHFAVVPQGWQGKLPTGVERIEAPTPYVWILGRTQTNGVADYPAVHAIQDGYKITPLSRWGKSPEDVKGVFDPKLDMKTPPMRQINALSAKDYFETAAALMTMHPPHLTDWSMTQRLKRVGIEPGQPFDFSKAPAPVQAGLTRAVAEGPSALAAKAPTVGRKVNGWQMNTDNVGVYGNSYLKRAIVALVGLGANEPADAIYPLGLVDADGKPLDGSHNYVMHFSKEDLPPVSAFWSLTMYDGEGFPVPNVKNRFAIGDRDPLVYNADGSLDVYIQHESPGADKEANWLPAPAKGPMPITMRLYGPKPEALEGRWNPPVVKKVN